MRRMLIVLATLVSGALYPVHAGIGVALEAAISAGDFADAAGGGGGIAVEYNVPWKERVELGVGVSVLTLGGKEFTFAGEEFFETTYAAVPIVVQGRYFPKGIDGGGFYAGGRLGLISVAAEITFASQLSDLDTDETETGLLIAPEVGYRFGDIVVYAAYSITSVEVGFFNIDSQGQFDPQTATIAWLDVGVTYLF